MSNNRPWDFDEAREACRMASQAQHAAEDALKEAARDLALAEQAYRLALAKRIVELRADGTPASVCADVARGDVEIARLKMKRDIASGVLDSHTHAAWRRTADRRDTAMFAQWSMKRDLAEGYGPHEPEWSEAVR